MTDEEFYDREIAPALIDAAKKCEARGMSAVMVVSLNAEGNTGRTAVIAADAPAIFRYLELLARCGEGRGINIDQFMMAVAKSARGSPHSSIVLSLMGVPNQPEPAL